MNAVTSNPAIRLSKWVHVFERGKVIALYHALNIDVICVPMEHKELVVALKKGTTSTFLLKQFPELSIDAFLAEMEAQGFVVPVGYDDMELLVAKRAEAIPPIGLHSLYLLLTDNCNLRCKYCFVLDGMPSCYRTSNMSWDVARTAIDMFFANLAKNDPRHERAVKMINLYGGEPLLRFPLLKQVVEYTETKYASEIHAMDAVGFIFSLVTNGTLITPEIASYLAEHPRIAVTVSVDGSEASHDAARRTTQDVGTYQAVLSGLRMLVAAGCKGLSLSCTITEHNIDTLEALLELHKEFGFLSINLNPLLDTQQQAVSDGYTEVVNDRMIEYFLKAREVGVYEDRIMRRIKPFMSRRPLPYDCQATGSQLVCSPSGRVGVCHEGLGMSNYFFADVSEDFSFHNNETVREWGRRSPFNMPQCFNCPAIAMCGGGCAYGAMLRNGSIWSLDDRFCTHALKTLEWMVWDLFGNS